MYAFILLNKNIENRGKIMLYAMLWYTMVWYDEWDSMRLYAILWDSNAMLWAFNAMLCNLQC